jgi:hypothetical protein
MSDPVEESLFVARHAGERSSELVLKDSKVDGRRGEEAEKVRGELGEFVNVRRINTTSLCRKELLVE